MVEYVNDISLTTEATRNLPLYPRSYVPVKLLLSVTFLTMTISPTFKSCGSSDKTVTVPELTVQVVMNL